MTVNVLKELKIEGAPKFRTGLVAIVEVSIDGKTWAKIAEIDRRSEYTNSNFKFARLIGRGIVMEKPPYKPRPDIPVKELPNGVKIARDSGSIYASTDGNNWYEA